MTTEDEMYAVVETPKGVWEVRWDGWYGLDEEDRPADRYQYAVSFSTYATQAEAQAWLQGYEQGARDNL